MNKRTIVGHIVGVALALAWTAGVTGLALEAQNSDSATFVLEPCIEEDGDGQAACYWGASERENGVGQDFIVLEGVTYYPEG